jgi:hypothetical protein
MEAAVGAAIRDIDVVADADVAGITTDCCLADCLLETEVGRDRVGFGESDRIVCLCSIVKVCRSVLLQKFSWEVRV